MNHSDMEPLLSPYADGELNRTQREFVERHVVGCAECRTTLDEYEQDRRQLASLRSTALPSDLKQAAMSRIEANQGLNELISGRKPPAMIRAGLIVAGAVIVAMAIGILQFWGAGTIERAEAATAALQSYRAVESITVTKYGETFDSEIDVAVSAPDRFRVSTRNNAGAVEVIGIGDERYTRGAGKEFADIYDVSARMGSFLDKVTGPSKSDDVTGLAINKNRALEILDSMVNLEQLPDEMIDGYDALHYRGEIDWAKIRWETKETKRSNVELWIDSTDFTIRQARVDIRVLIDGLDGPTAEWFTMTSWVKYFAFNEPIEIEPPLTSSGDIEPGWSLVGVTPLTPKKSGPADVRTR